MQFHKVKSTFPVAKVTGKIIIALRIQLDLFIHSYNTAIRKDLHNIYFSFHSYK